MGNYIVDKDRCIDCLSLFDRRLLETGSFELGLIPPWPKKLTQQELEKLLFSFLSYEIR